MHANGFTNAHIQIDDDHDIFDLQNEPYGIDASTVFELVSPSSQVTLSVSPADYFCADASRHQRCPFLGRYVADDPGRGH